MEVGGGLSECESGWLIVESDLSTRLTRPDQLRYALQCMGRNPSDRAVDRYWSQCGGSMSYEQFCLAMQKEKRTTMSDLMKSFRKIDINGDGYITAKELHRMLTKRGERMSHDEVQAIIDEADSNGDRKLDYAEFCHMLLNTSEQCIHASKMKAERTGHTSQSGLSKSKARSGQVFPQHHRGSKSRSSARREDGLDRRERRREEIRSQLYPQDDHVRQPRPQPHLLLHQRQSHAHHRSGVEVDRSHNGGTVYPGGELQNGSLHEPVPHLEAIDPAGYHEKPHPALPAQSTSRVSSAHPQATELDKPTSSSSLDKHVSDSPVQPDKPVLDSPVQPDQPVSLTDSSTTIKAADDESEAPPTSQERGGETKQADKVENAAETAKEAPPKPHPPDTEDQTHADSVTAASKLDESGSQITVVASSEKISDPFAISSSSLPKLPPLKNTSLPPLLLPPIGAVTVNKMAEEKEPVVGGPERQENPPLSNGGESDGQHSASKTDGGGDKDVDTGEAEAPPLSSDVSSRQQAPERESDLPPITAAGEEGREDVGEGLKQVVKQGEQQGESSDERRERESEGGEQRGQTDHLDEENSKEKVGRGKEETRSGEGRQAKAVSPPTSVVTPPPKQPRNIKTWNSITGKGCFYLEVGGEGAESGNEEGGVIRCHQYRLSLPSPTNVWIEMGVAKPGLPATDVLLFVFHTDKDDEPSELVTYTQHKVGERWISRLDLDAGTYALVPFTSGCHLKQREDPIVDGHPLTAEGEGGKVLLTEPCQEALKEIFHRIDLDGNGCISRMEFDFFQEKTSGESCDDDAWKVIQDNFELTGDDEITLKGFLDLHVMTAEDEEGGEGEVWEILEAMGYNKRLELDQACPFTLEVFTEDCEGEIEIVDLLPFNPVVDSALCRLVMERGVSVDVRDGGGDLSVYTFTTPHLTTIVLENKGSKKASLQLDCSRSTNAVHSRDSSVCVLPLKPKSTTIGIHLLPDNENEPYKVDCIASKILC